jgi:thiol-disulfide isomerase/thioredoxin
MGHGSYFIEFLMVKPAVKFVFLFLAVGLFSGAVYAQDVRTAHPFLKSFFKVDMVDPPMSSNVFFFRGITPDIPPVQPLAARGHWLIVNVWATWCAPCLYELPGFDVLQAANLDIRVWAVSVDKALDPRAMAAIQKRLGMAHVSLYHDYGRVLDRAINTKSLPATMVIDPAGQVRVVLYGQNDWGGAMAQSFMDDLSQLFPQD